MNAQASASRTILVVDDERNIRRTLRMVLEGEGWQVHDVGTAEDAATFLSDEAVDLLITDVRLPGMSGVELLQDIRSKPELQSLPIIVISGHASPGEAADAIRLGATDFFEKPLDRERVLVSVRNALRAAGLAREVETLRAGHRAKEEMIGEGPAMQKLFVELEKVAPTKGRVLITGESGTGKELVARAIHRLSPRARGPFIKLNCAAIPHELVESELFGHEKGSFTGAHARKRGHFELAHDGTLFLDEIGDMPLGVQGKLLRALQSGEITRVGGDAPLTVDVRVVAATNRDLERDVADGRFREDLFFRLNVVPVRTPPLRERPEDIAGLTLAFVRDFCRENGFREKPVRADVLQELSRRWFPGNVRELKNVVERMVILAGDELTLADLPDEGRIARSSREKALQEGHGKDPLARREKAGAERAHPAAPEEEDDDELGAAAVAVEASGRLSLREYRDRAERTYILETLREVEWNISRAAGLLGIERTNLHKRMRSLQVRREE